MSAERNTPTTRTMDKLTAEGYDLVELVEWRDRYMHTHDLFGFGDVLALRGVETLLVQTTTDSNANARLNKINDSPHLPAVLAAGWRVIVHGWRPDGRLRVIELTNTPPEQLTLWKGTP